MNTFVINFKFKPSIICLLLVTFSFITQAQHNASTELKIKALIGKMTLEEKIGQLSQYVGRTLMTGPSAERLSDSLLKDGHTGSVLNVAGAKLLHDLQYKAITNSRLKIPLLFGYDVIHGFKTIFPVPLAESCSWDIKAMERSAQIAAMEASASGLHWTFAPMVDIARDARWGRVVEGAGEDTYLGEEIAKARVHGFQWDLGSTNSVLATAKHFAAYGLPQAGRDYGPVDMSDRTLHDIYLPPFKAAVDAGALTFMSSFNEINGVPATASTYLLKDLLQKEWQFKGFVVSDWEAVAQLEKQGVAADGKDAARIAFNSGTDMDMTDGLYNRYMAALVKEGKVSMALINESVAKVLRVKYLLGLFDDPYRFSNEEREKATIMKPEFIAAARDMARKSIVLLKNEAGTLPLKKAPGSIAVIGPLADNQNELLGSWSAKGQANQVVTLLQGIKNIAGADTKISYAKGCDIEGQDTSGFAAAYKLALQSDYVIVAVGEKGLMSGESRSRAFLDLPGVQNDLVKRLVASGKKVIVVLMNGRPLTINWISEHAAAVLETWFLGSQAGNAIADVLFGDYNPSAKLTITFPRAEGQVPAYYNYKTSGRPGDMNEASTTRHIDLPNSPLYPFGYGLSYTTYNYGVPLADKAVYKRNEKINVTTTVSNTGKIAGDEIVQLYVRDIVASVTRPIKELKGFSKVHLEAGESKKVTITIDPAKLGFYGLNMKYITEPGDYLIMVGPDSEHVKSIKVNVQN